MNNKMTLEYMRRINRKFNKGITDGQQGAYKPGLIFGVFRQSYTRGYEQGERMRKRAQVLTKK